MKNYLNTLFFYFLILSCQSKNYDLTSETNVSHEQSKALFAANKGIKLKIIFVDDLEARSECRDRCDTWFLGICVQHTEICNNRTRVNDAWTQPQKKLIAEAIAELENQINNPTEKFKKCIEKGPARFEDMNRARWPNDAAALLFSMKNDVWYWPPIKILAKKEKPGKPDVLGTADIERAFASYTYTLSSGERMGPTLISSHTDIRGNEVPAEIIIYTNNVTRAISKNREYAKRLIKMTLTHEMMHQMNYAHPGVDIFSDGNVPYVIGDCFATNGENFRGPNGCGKCETIAFPLDSSLKAFPKVD